MKNSHSQKEEVFTKETSNLDCCLTEELIQRNTDGHLYLKIPSSFSEEKINLIKSVIELINKDKTSSFMNSLKRAVDFSNPLKTYRGLKEWSDSYITESIEKFVKRYK